MTGATCIACYSDPCTCQRQLAVVEPKKEVQQKYLFKKCENRDCTVMIGWKLGSLQGSAICKHCQAGVAHWQRDMQETS